MNAHTLNIIINYQLPPVEITNYTAPLNAILPNLRTGNTLVLYALRASNSLRKLFVTFIMTRISKRDGNQAARTTRTPGELQRVWSSYRVVLPNTFKAHLVVSIRSEVRLLHFKNKIFPSLQIQY